MHSLPVDNNLDVDDKHDVSRAVISWGWVRLGLSLCLLGLPVLLGCFGLQFADLRSPGVHKDESVHAWVQNLREQKADLERISQQTLIQLKALTLGLASRHGGLARPNILGTRIVDTAANGSTAVPSAAIVPVAAPDSGFRQDRRSTIDSGYFRDQVPPPFALGANRQTSGLASASASVISHFFAPLRGHKHGRLIDPAAYLHTTIR